MKSICIHGHFYQPPRENPWIEMIEAQASAHPFHDWNERIAAESYGPNGAARILDKDGYVEALSNNYSRMSFNFGPTLLAWLESTEPSIYQSILRADSMSRDRFSGHGAAIAQAYNHLIMPLANARDRQTQVRWGIRDFEHRFQRPPEGMWLPEAAADIATLEALAQEGIRFTILAPRQAARFRSLGTMAWSETSNEDIDTTRAYLCRLPSGNDISVFFYDGELSREVAFNRLLNDGRAFANRLSESGGNAEGQNPLVHIATDGESYGHHHRFGDMALASALENLEQRSDVELTVYGEYLARNPPETEVEIVDGSSWSCEHGIERWRSDCGCGPGRHSDWRQQWRSPLREALDNLRDAANPLFEDAARQLLTDPWAARDDYVAVVLDRSASATDRYVKQHGLQAVAAGDDRTRLLQMMELQRNLMLCYTSCGWFFDEISDIEPVQVMAYAARAIELSKLLFGVDLELQFLDVLAHAPSNVPEIDNGRQVYLDRVKPLTVGLNDVAVNAALCVAFQNEVRLSDAHEHTISNVRERRLGGELVIAGHAAIRSKVTGESQIYEFATIAAGFDSIGAIRPVDVGQDPKHALSMVEQDTEGDLDAREWLRTNFSDEFHDLGDLLPDVRSAVLDGLLTTAISETERVVAAVEAGRKREAERLKQVGRTVPRHQSFDAAYVLNRRLGDELKREIASITTVELLLARAEAEQIQLERDSLGLHLERAIVNRQERLQDGTILPAEFGILERLITLATNGQLDVDTWRIQSMMFEILRAYCAATPANQQMLEQVRQLAARLRVGPAT